MKNNAYALMFALLFAITPNVAAAQTDRGSEPVEADAPTRSELASRRAAIDKQIADLDHTRDEDTAETNDFAGLKFGVGISFTLDSGDQDRVSDASLVNGVVRVNDENNGRARIMLESHYFFTPDFSHAQESWGIGPFVALQPGTDDIIESIGMGFMIGFRRGKSNESFNIGFGAVVDPNTRILGDGIIADLPLPAGETNVRYKEEMQTGLLILSSFSF